MPAPATSQQLIELIRKSGLLSEKQLGTLLSKLDELPADPIRTAAALVKYGLITPFQAKLLLAGRHRGFRLGAYVIRDQIGQGGMGAVYLAEHLALKRLVAIKVLSPASGNSKIAVERFLREARAAALLDHPNIVRLFDIGQQDDLHFLVLEYVEGQTLDKLLENNGAVAASKAIEYIMQAAAGLQHAYEKGLVHRDIKPSNLILAKDGTVKILDMGLARQFETGKQITEVLDQGAIVGTADYISPEQAMNTAKLDIRSDIYSLGATLFTLLTGRTLFEGNTTQKLLQHQMKLPPCLSVIDRTLPPGLAVVVGRMLAKDRNDRQQTPAEVIEELTPWWQPSPKMIAGLARTDHNLSRTLQKSLALAASGDSTTLNADRVREEVQPESAEPIRFPSQRNNRLVLIVVSLIASLLSVSGLLIAFALGLFPSTGGASGQASTSGTNTPPTGFNLPGVPLSQFAAKATKAKCCSQGLVYKLDLSTAQAFSESGGMVIPDPARFATRIWQSQSRNGPGSWPAGWRPLSGHPATQAEFLITRVAGSPAIGMRNLSGPPTAILNSPDFVVPSNKLRLTLSYQTDAEEAGLQVRFRPIFPKEQDSFEIATLEPSPREWRTREIVLDLSDVNAGRIEIHQNQASGTFWLRRFEVGQVDPSLPLENVVWSIDLSQQKPFVQRAIAAPGAAVPVRVLEERGEGKLPLGWYRWVEFANSEVEFFADGGANEMAIGIRTVSGNPGVMATLPEFNVPSRTLRVRVLYQAGASGATLRFRPTQPTRQPVVEVLKLPPTGTSWQLAMVDLNTQGYSRGMFELYNTAPGLEGAVRIRELVVFDPSGESSSN